MKADLHWLNLSFKNANKDFEKDFQDSYLSRHLNHYRVAYITSLSVFIVFGLLDYVLIHDGIPKETWFIRYVIVVPIGLIVLALSFVDSCKRYITALMSGLFFLAAFGIALMPLYLPSPGNLVYPFGVGLVFTALTNYLRVRFIEALACISLSLVVLFYFLVFKMDYQISFTFSREIMGFVIDEKEALAVATFSIIFTTGVFSIVGLYSYEKGERKNYLLSRKLQSQATIDSLTQLNNRQYLDTMLEEEFKRARREKSPLSLIMIDIDHFKHYNDQYGHVAGDASLKRVAKALKENLHRPSNFAARYGGEEFCIVLPNTDSSGARQLAEILRNSILKLSIPHALSSTHDNLTISLGVCTVNCYEKLENVDEVIKTADLALYHAKKAGRNCYAYQVINDIPKAFEV